MNKPHSEEKVQNSDGSEFVADDNDIRFDPSEEQEKKTKKRTKKIKRNKKAKWYALIPLILLLIIVISVVGWFLMPKKKLNVCVLDKTVLTIEEGNDIVEDSIYRKHQGLFWLLNQQKYVLENKKEYDYKEDYFGAHLDAEGKLSGMKDLSTLDYTPDIMYVADVYGAVDDTFGYYDKGDAKGQGLTVDDMSAISYAHESGATVIAEMELFNSGLSDSVYSQMTNLCGIKPTTWVGRYIFELQDFTDVPDWAPPMYEQQEGVEWQFSGPGILLVSAEGKIIILEQKTDFESKNLLQIYINEEYEDEFKSCNKVNFYNWFEIVEANYDTDVIATFEFDVNATGMEKLKGVLTSPRFVAATRKNHENKAPVYYFAADFNDYVSHLNFNKFLFADTVYRWISYDRQGDISNFFWNFYNPMMTKILSDTYKIVKEKEPEKTEPVETNCENGKFQVLVGDKWQDFDIKGISINAFEPGNDKYSRNFDYYQGLVEELVDLGVNCVYLKDLLPPEFYSALYKSNRTEGKNPIYIIQNIPKPSGLSHKKFNSEKGIKAWQKYIKLTIDALHGNGAVGDKGPHTAATYFIDVSPYVLALNINPDFNTKNINSFLSTGSGYKYKGTYTSSDSPVEAYAAMLYDTAQTYLAQNYKKTLPIGLSAQAENLKNCGWNTSSETVYNFEGIINKDKKKEVTLFTNVELAYGSSVFTAYPEYFAEQSEFNAYEIALMQIQGATENLLISGVSVPSNLPAYENVSGDSEKEQGSKLVELLNTIDNINCMGSVVFDLNDNWNAVSKEYYKYTVPSANNPFWHNVSDPAQMSGVVSVESIAPEGSMLTLSDDDRMQQMNLSANEEYLYLTIQLFDDLDFTVENFYVGFDTYQRNDGEYYYAADATHTSLSGMEYVLRFKNKQTAELYVTTAYDRGIGGYKTAESYNGSYNLIADLKYGGFTTSENQFYQTGSTIYVRIPWTWLNVTDPSQKLVMSDGGPVGNQVKTVKTNGVLVSLLISDKVTGDMLYAFPESKQSPGYKLFKWMPWEDVEYQLREKDSFILLKKYYSK